MKIRTDFVTNSSSSNNAEIMIDNPVLLEILQKYKDLGLFGNQEPMIDIGNNMQGIRTLTFYYCEDTYYWYGSEDNKPFTNYAPDSLVDVLNCIIGIFSEMSENRLGYLDDQVCDRLIAELEEKEEDINGNFVKVSWKYYGGEDSGGSWEEYRYDSEVGERSSGIIYEDYGYEDEEDEDDDDDDE